MKFLIDAHLPPALGSWLQLRGHESEHVNDLGMVSAPDADIAAYAEAEGLMIISKDEDFFYLRWQDRYPLLWLRCGNASNRKLSLWLNERWGEVERLLAKGERLIELR